MTRVLIMGAAGRDFHNFNMVYRDSAHEVVAFTATQIPGIDGRRYPPELAGPRYPKGIPIEPEEHLEQLVKTHRVQLVVLAYSDLSHLEVMEKASRALAAGADFALLGPDATMLKSKKPVIAVTAVRTGCGKSQTTRKVCESLRSQGKKVVAVRHPMPYGDLAKQAVQRFASREDLAKAQCTIEEREEYEPYLERGIVVYAGVDYARILEQAEREADVVLWDGGNNDVPFFRPDVHICVADPLRPGHELTYYPGRVNLRMAHIILLNKANTAKREDLDLVERNCRQENPRATVLRADSVLSVEKSGELKGKRCLAIEDGPTVTHGGMAYGAAAVAARQFGASLVSPLSAAKGSISETFRKYPHLQEEIGRAHV